MITSREWSPRECDYAFRQQTPASARASYGHVTARQEEATYESGSRLSPDTESAGAVI